MSQNELPKLAITKHWIFDISGNNQNQRNEPISSRRNPKWIREFYSIRAIRFIICELSTRSSRICWNCENSSFTWKSFHESWSWVMESFREKRVIGSNKGSELVHCKSSRKSKNHQLSSYLEYQKARLVSKGYPQQYDSDFHETFAPIVRCNKNKKYLMVCQIFSENWRKLKIIYPKVFEIKTWYQ